MSIVVVPADKSGATLIMDKGDHIKKANAVFSDTSANNLLAEHSENRQTEALKKKCYKLGRQRNDKIN